VAVTLWSLIREMHLGGGALEPSPLLLRPLFILLYQPSDDDGGWRVWRSWWNDWQGKPRYSEKTCPRAVLFTTNPTWRDAGSNQGHHGGKQAINRLAYSMAWELLGSYRRALLFTLLYTIA
jgi:hypothetical protein